MYGCPRCFTNNRESSKNKFQQTYAQTYETTRIEVARMRSLGYEVREMLECEFDGLRKRQPEIAWYLEPHPVMSRITLNPRDAFFGGRSENIVTSCTVESGEEITEFKYSLKIMEATLIVRRVKINPRILIAHANALAKATAKYPVTRVEVKTFTPHAGIHGDA